MAAESAMQILTDKDLALLEKYRVERAKRLRADGVAQYQATDGEFEHFLHDPWVKTPLSRAPLAEEVDVLVVGGGWSGMLTALRLRQAGIDSIRIIESGSDFGGVWYWNRYPGCRCDVDSFIYIPLLEETGYVPTEKYAKTDDIRRHAQTIGKQFDLYRHAVFQTRATELRWSDEEARWIVSTDRKDVFKARFAFIGNGPLDYPKLPGIPGIESFKGKSFHTSRWDYEYTGGGAGDWNLANLRDQRVALIGTGSSGVQCVAPLGQWAKQLYVVQRTPATVSIRDNKPLDPLWVGKQKPGWQWERQANFEGVLFGLLRDVEDMVGDEWTDIWGPPPLPEPGVDRDQFAALVQKIDIEKMERVRARIDSIVKDPVTAQALKPYYNRFCRRPTFNDEYLPTFNRSNVKLIDTKGRGLDRITENAIVFGDQSYEVDCIVYATGFELLTYSHKSAGFQVFGRGGQTIDQKWSKVVNSLHGIYTRGFPNLFFVQGTRQASPSLNWPFMTNEQAVHCADVIRRLLQDNVKVMEVSQEAEERWGKTIIEKSKLNVEYIRQCTPSFINSDGNLGDLGRQAFATTYGDGHFKYIDALKEWRMRGGMFDDLELRRE
jgi:cation diffusion facilitator CzcD-associated flavoprotein CzcO